MNTNETDWLKDLFNRLPAEEPSPSFRESVMKRIAVETEKKRERNELIGLLSVIGASAVFIAIIVGAFIFADIPQIEWRMPEFDMPSAHFYFYIGALALILLFADHFLCKAYRKKRGVEQG